MIDPGFPLLVIRPTAGAGEEWAAVSLLGAEAADAAALNRTFVDFGLAQAIAGLPCRMSAAAIARLDAAQLPHGLELLALPEDVPPAEAPPVAPGRSPKHALLLRLLEQITRDAETRDIEATLKHDPQLSVQLLRLVNSVAFAPATRITSFAHAITLLGRRQLQRWLQLLLYASHGTSEAASPLMAAAALRASLMEALCKAAGDDPKMQDEAFMVGMFSLLEALFAQPLAAIIEPLQLAAPVNAALLRHEGRLGRLLALAEAAGHGPADVAPALEHCGIGTERWCKAQIDALRWTRLIGREA